jgi:hypothetical protein
VHEIEPYYNWRNYYVASEDPQSPFYDREYSEMYYTEAIYDHYIHPQWDNIGSPTLYIKVLFADYQDEFAIIELMGEWNDCINNDIMMLKRDIIEIMMQEGISKFILIGENVLNFHSSDELYYDEWFDDVEDMGGWIALLNFREHVLDDFQAADIDSYFVMGGKLNDMGWRTYTPIQLFKKVNSMVMKRLGENL